MNTGADSVRGTDVGKGEREGFRRPRRRGCPFCNDGAVVIDYKDPAMLRYFISDRGKIAPRRVSGVCAKHQREPGKARERDDGEVQHGARIARGPRIERRRWAEAHPRRDRGSPVKSRSARSANTDAAARRNRS